MIGCSKISLLNIALIFKRDSFYQALLQFFFCYRFVWFIFHFIDSNSSQIVIAMSRLSFRLNFLSDVWNRFSKPLWVWLDPSIIGSSFLKDFGTLARTHCAGKVILPKSYKYSNESSTQCPRLLAPLAPLGVPKYYQDPKTSLGTSRDGLKLF